MILALFTAARKPNPHIYDEAIDILRVICEVFLLLVVAYDVFVQFCQVKRYKHIASCKISHN